ncbi:hypothetical protein M378DRAFT_820846 [Amanita muscaria Koide BX008]|uniref:NACHT domain-containing protein n=1 Tax=Amanita muscaria (strain Koide BX008) TaxID=946122 RepID=A0A0C2T5B1_AMAMK|nr:hypothetical protein M378DRAFT_820846 [Amanita muscaria Koide BX008]
MNSNQAQTPWQPSLLPGQQQPQPAQPDVAQHPQQSHFQALPPPATPQWMLPQSLLPPPPEQSAFYTNYDYGSQWHGQQHLYQQPQPHVPLPVPQPPPQPVAQLDYNSHQHTAGYPAQPAAFPQPQQQQQRLDRTPPPQDLRPAKHQRFDGPNLSRQAHHHAPLRRQRQFQPLSSPAQNTGVYTGQSQGSGQGDGDDWLHNMQLSANKRGRGARGGSTSSGGGRRAGQSGGGVRAHGSGGNLGGATSIQAEGAQNVNVSGNSTLMNIGTNSGHLTTVNNYGGTHGLERLEKFVSFAALRDSAKQDPDRRCHPGTRKTVLTWLRDWFDNSNPTDRIIWLHGPAGAGKSAIAQTIADEYKKRGVAATFFFYRSDASRNNGHQLFPTIAWQLALSIPPTKNFIVHALDETPHLPTQAVEPQFEGLVVHPFHAMNHIATQMLHPAPVVIIDGVDECSNEQLQRRFLTVIGDIVKDCRVPLRFLIVSRPEVLIEETLNSAFIFSLC